MQVQVYSPNLVIDRELREHAERRIGFALDRVSGQVNWVGIRLGDLSRAKTTNKHCQVQISLRGGATLSVEQADGNIFQSVIGAAERAEEAVSRFLDAAPSNPRGRAGDLGRYEQTDGEAKVRNVDHWRMSDAGRRESRATPERPAPSPGETLLEK